MIKNTKEDVAIKDYNKYVDKLFNSIIKWLPPIGLILLILTIIFFI